MPHPSPDRAIFHALGVPLLLYVAASLLHFAHNAEFLDAYPNLPRWLTRADVYLAWCGEAALGLVGYVLVRRGLQPAGLSCLGVHALLGFDGLLHYGRAPMSAHTAAMNFTILFEAGAAAVLLAAVLRYAARSAQPFGRHRKMREHGES